nr:hypothetical protein [Tanacetum cinerariifolium]
MSSAFVDTHNMVSILTKSKASEGFDQIIDFLNGNYIKDVLRLDDAEGVDCLPNEEIFAELARMGYKKPSTKLTFYKAFFSSQWKFLIHTILQSMSTKRTSWNDFSSAMAYVVICLSTVFSITYSTHSTTITTSRYSNHILTLDTCAALTGRVKHLEHDKVAQELEVIKLKTRLKKLEKANKVKALKLRRLRKVVTSQRVKSSADTDMEDEDEPEVQEVVEVVTTAKLIIEVVTASSTIVSAARTIIPAAEPKVPVATPTAALVRVVVASTRRRKEWLLGIQKRNQLKKLLLKPTPRTKAKDIDWDTTIEHVKQKSKEDKSVQRYQVMKKRPQTESQARRNMIMYLKNTAGFRLDYFKRMSYDDIRPIFEAKFNANIEFLLKSNEQIEEEENRAIKSINETLAQKVAKRRPA